MYLKKNHFLFVMKYKRIVKKTFTFYRPLEIRRWKKPEMPRETLGLFQQYVSRFPHSLSLLSLQRNSPVVNHKNMLAWVLDFTIFKVV